MMRIDLTALQRAINSLDEAIIRAKQEKNDELIRDGVIQRFEYTFELSIKMLKRILEKISLYPNEIDHYSYHQLLREAAEKGLIVNVESWIHYRYQRNITSHVYHQDKAISVFKTSLQFIDDAKLLLSQLKERQNDKY